MLLNVRKRQRVILVVLVAAIAGIYFWKYLSPKYIFLAEHVEIDGVRQPTPKGFGGRIEFSMASPGNARGNDGCNGMELELQRMSSTHYKVVGVRNTKKNCDPYPFYAQNFCTLIFEDHDKRLRVQYGRRGNRGCQGPYTELVFLAAKSESK